LKISTELKTTLLQTDGDFEQQGELLE